ncbi:maleylpyruvate isomerase N-terminal domain-containing protein [Kutzneria buriramensis]|uniref:Uncharacterized protein (TIGR03083 family) n=1 Tax=Kutzneria buriramensis TaxID=1045776 RepID=A0A3E0I994_9PSEU|nr:maleylpyruvate isomerase N-terminal domain-containing protein [Kutzneria buriramensis]REH55302.1 uncharacterized protein (TIGR03083 family) [Kutzneria buriramensis]
MHYAELTDAFHAQSTAFRESAIQAGPDIPIATCPDWRMEDLVVHVVGVYDFILRAMEGEQAKFERSSGSWPELLAHLEDVVPTLLQRLRDGDPDQQVWTSRDKPTDLRSMARRLAHETAIHRLDADSAVKDLPTLVYGTEFAADGVDEFVNAMLPAITERRPPTVAGTVLYHAADAGQIWQVQVDIGTPVAPTEPGAAVNADVSVVGTADAVYRSVWGRPSTAVVSGDRSVLAALTPP